MIRRLIGLLACSVFAISLSGCAPGQSDVEKSIRDEMKSKMNVEVKSIDIKKQGDGSYLGTATAENGDVYDVTTEPPKENKIAWKAVPSQATLERMIRDEVAAKNKLKIKSFSLTKTDGPKYDGTADTEQGVKLKITASLEGGLLKWEAVPMER